MNYLMLARAFLFTALAISCEVPVTPENSILVNAETVLEGSLSYECISGYRLASGSNSRTCLSNRSWTGTPPVCIGNLQYMHLGW